MELSSCLKNEVGRAALPEETVARIEGAFEGLGIALECQTRSCGGLHSARVAAPALGYRAIGKGTTALLARASGLAELVERISAYAREEAEGAAGPLWNELLIDAPPVVVGDQASVGSALTCAELVAGLGLSRREIEWIEGRESSQHWVAGFAVSRGEPLQVPYRLVRELSDSNGLAAGNAVEEAIVHAACEVFERYGHRVQVERQIVPTIALDSIGHPKLSEWVSLFAAADVEVIIKDYSLDGLVPVVGLLTINHAVPGDDVQYRTLQLGASFDSLRAVERCFTERLQGRSDAAEIIPGLAGKKVRPAEAIESHRQLANNRVYYGDGAFMEEGEVVGFEAREVILDAREEIALVEDICGRMGTELIVVDHTLPVLGFPVVRVVIPGVSDCAWTGTFGRRLRGEMGRGG